ncbi:4-hydroxy-tetrahydrodipicolinate synthase [Candidatus Woesearchaeota archaeon]|nr:4-hydroxy-tetrahydrodipicolinate synthase [Candidatus Woesearchaeota archaeon]
MGSNEKTVRISGAITAMVTPFRQDGSLDITGLKENVEFQIQQGISGLVPLGTTGESPTVTEEERKAIITAVVETARKRIPVIVGTGTNSTATTVEHTRVAKELGADAVLIVSPYYNKPTQEGLYRHFKAVAEAVDIPIIVYNIKGRTAVNIETATMERFKGIKNIVGVKEASGDLNQMKDVIAKMPKDFVVLSGDDNMTLELMKAGGVGVISVISNLLPRKVADLCAYAMQKNYAEAEKVNSYLAPLFKAAFIETNPIPIKEAMEMAGMPAGPLRLPLCELRPENRETLRKVLAGMGVVE